MLQDEQREEILDELLDGSISFSEAEKRSDQCKVLAAAKEAFVKEFELTSWTNAQAKFPKFARDDLLKKFKVVKGKPLPKAFEVCSLCRNRIIIH